jgi:tetratricopeptide (TPR) repeat protein
LLESGEHLSSEQVSLLVEELESGGSAVIGFKYRQRAHDHVSQCTQCADLVAAQQHVGVALRSLEVKVNSQRRASCPRETRWSELAAGAVSGEEGRGLLDHAALCECCGPLLRQAIVDLNSELTPAEESFLEQLPSAQPEWQRTMARRMAKASQAVKPRWQFKRVLEALTFRQMQVELRWALVAVVLILVVGGSGLWYEMTPHLSSTNQLLAQAYTRDRTLELRVFDAAYAPLRQQKGGSTSPLERPQAWFDAELQIERALEAHPKDPKWLQAKARADLLAGDARSSVDSLSAALVIDPTDSSLEIDLASGFFERGDYSRAIDLLNKVITADPKNQIALFNRAVVRQRQGDSAGALGDWEAYLRLDSNSAWAREARQRLQEAQRDAPHT